MATGSGAERRATLEDGHLVQVSGDPDSPTQPRPPLPQGRRQPGAGLLTDGDPPYDPAMGTYQLRALLCHIEKAEAPEA